MNGDYTKYLYGERGAHIVILPTSAAVWLWNVAGLRDFRARGHISNREINAAVIAIGLAASAASGSGPAPTPEPARESGHTLTTRDAAGQLNVGIRTIVRAINERRLNAIKDDEGRWRIDPHALDQYRRR